MFESILNAKVSKEILVVKDGMDVGKKKGGKNVSAIKRTLHSKAVHEFLINV